MNSELLKKIYNYRDCLINYRKSLKAEKAQIEAKFNKGLNLTKKEIQRNQYLAELLKDNSNELNKFNILHEFDKIRDNIKLLAYGTLVEGKIGSIPKEKKLNLLSLVKEYFTRCKENAFANAKENLSADLDLSFKVSDLIIFANDDIDNLKADAEILKRYGHPTDEIEEKIATRRADLEDLEVLRKLNFDEEIFTNAKYAIEQGLFDLDTKNKVFKDLMNIFNNFLNVYIEEFDKELAYDEEILKYSNSNLANEEHKDDKKDDEINKKSEESKESKEVKEVKESKKIESQDNFTSDINNEKNNKTKFNKFLDFIGLTATDEELEEETEEIDNTPYIEEPVTVDMNSEENRESLRKRTKNKLNALGRYISNHKVGLISIGVLATIIAGILTACNRNKDNDIVPATLAIETPNPYETEKPIDNAPEVTENEEFINTAKLVMKGYEPEVANNLALTYSDALINRLCSETMPLYGLIDGFDATYLSNYEEARTILNIPAEKAVDYVNRANKIQEYNFFDKNEVSTYEIVTILMDIDNRNLQFPVNSAHDEAIVNGLNRLVEEYLSSSKPNLNAINALPYFAKENSDLNIFLRKYSELLNNVIVAPQDMTAKDKLYNFLQIFSKSLNGFTNADTHLTSDKDFNESAIVESDYDMFIAFDTFVRGSLRMAMPKNLTADTASSYDIKLDNLQMEINDLMEEISGSICPQLSK